MSTQAAREAALDELRRRVGPVVWGWWCAQAMRGLEGPEALTLLTPAQARAVAEDLMARWLRWARMRLEARLAAAGMRPAVARWVARRLPAWVVARLVQ